MSGSIQEFTKGIWKDNPVFKMVLGLCPLLAVTSTAINGIAMGVASTFVLVCSNTVVSTLRNIIPSKVRIPSFIIVIASLVQIVEMAVKKLSPVLFRQLGIFLPLMTTNCAILGLAIFQTNRGYGFLQGLTFAVGAGLGLTLALVLMASIRESVEFSDVPGIAKGTGLVLIIAGTLSMAFMGFAGLL